MCAQSLSADIGKALAQFAGQVRKQRRPFLQMQHLVGLSWAGLTDAYEIFHAIYLQPQHDLLTAAAIFPNHPFPADRS